MINLKTNESVLFIVRKHWFVMVPTLMMFLVLLLVPAVFTAAIFGPMDLGLTDELRLAVIDTISSVLPFIYAAGTFYVMALLLGLLVIWTDYYLDMWIITNQRIIDIEQYGLFSREVAEIPLKRVQDVTTEVHGIFETFLKFGTIRIQTAGEREFFIHSAPHHEETKELLLNSIKHAQRSEELHASTHR